MKYEDFIEVAAQRFFEAKLKVLKSINAPSMPETWEGTSSSTRILYRSYARELFSEKLCFVTNQPPGPASEFVELESPSGTGIGIGEWVQKNEFWELQVPFIKLKD